MTGPGGRSGRHPTYVLIPGAGGSAWTWHLVADELERRGHDVVVVCERLGISPDEMDGGHLPMLARPLELADRLEAYAASTSGTGTCGRVV